MLTVCAGVQVRNGVRSVARIVVRGAIRLRSQIGISMGFPCRGIPNSRLVLAAGLSTI